MDKIKSVFAKMVKLNSKGSSSVFYTNYDNARQLVKLLCALPDTIIDNVTLTDSLYDGYNNLFLVNYSDANEISAQKAFIDTGNIARSDSTYERIYLDSDFISESEAYLYDIETDKHDIKFV